MAERESRFLEVLSAPCIDVDELEQLASYGIVESCGIRALTWRILLKYLSPKRKVWDAALLRTREEYDGFVNDLIICPGKKAYSETRTDVTLEDHPLNPNPRSEWNSYFQDNEILNQIDKDVRRLCPDMSFFQTATPYPCDALVNPANRSDRLYKRVQKNALQYENVSKNRSGMLAGGINKKKQAVHEYAALPEGSEAHWEVVERILFIYAKLNPGTGYVQGMNEIVGPIYYTFASDPNKEWAKYAECDTFFCFTNLMSEIRDHFIKTLDDSLTGINGSMDRVSNLLKFCDQEVWGKLHEQKIRQEFYLFRWMSLLLSQEFSLPDTIRMWDSLFSDTHRFDLLVSVCVAMIILVRGELLQGDFGHNMKLLQNYPETIQVPAIVAKAKALSIAEKARGRRW